MRRRRWGGCGAIVGLVLVALLPAAARAQEDAAAARIAERVAAAELPELRWPRFPEQREILAALYEPRGFAPLWLEAGRPTRSAGDAADALLGADALGLSSADYDSIRLEATRQGLAEGAVASAASQADFDVALSVNLLRFLAALHAGRVNPKRLSFGFEAHPRQLDLAGALADAVREERVPALVAAAPPPFTQHRLLLEQLARYRALAADTTVGPVAVSGTLRPGDPCPGADGLARWLAALGDLRDPQAAAPAAQGATPFYDGELVAAVRRFQARHGLAADGVIGKETARALAVPAERRVRQIELALERLRWIPEMPPGRAVFVNIPAFELFAFEELGGRGEAALSMRVVVGKAATRTPVFTGTIQTVVFAPYWNVPRSIVVNEYLPKLLRGGGLARDMEIVGGGVAELAAGKARLRQRPGPRNALGRVKFLFPNTHSVYLHDTPSRGLFARARRDFSHGCIRVEQPVELAEWVLRDRADWPPERMQAAMAAASETHVRVEPQIPVVIFYTTAVARPDGTIGFYDDVYQYDAKLERALAGGYPYR